MVAAAATANAANAASANGAGSDADAMGRIGEGEELEETNPLAIVPDSNPIPSPRRGPPTPGADAALAGTGAHGQGQAGVSVGQVKKEEVESKIAAWQIAEVAKVNNRFKREEVVINGWEGDQVEKASAWLKKYEVIDHQSTDQTPSLNPAAPFPTRSALNFCCARAEEAGGEACQGDGEGAERGGQGAAEGGGEARVGGGQAGHQGGARAGARQLHEGRREGALHQALLLLNPSRPRSSSSDLPSSAWCSSPPAHPFCWIGSFTASLHGISRQSDQCRASCVERLF